MHDCSWNSIVCLFAGRMLTFDEKNELVAAACHQYVHREIRASEFINQQR